VLGKVVDTVGIMPALLLLNSFITLAYGFSMIDSTFTAYLAAILYICYVSFYSSQSYCYVSDTFSSCHFGKLVGIIHMIAGFLSLLKIPMQSLVVHVFHSEYLYPCLIMLGFCLCNFIVLFWLVYLKRKDPHPFWSKSARDAVKKEQERQDAMKRERKEKRMQEKEARKRENEGRPAHAVEMA
ncbi:putative transporter, partial [Toxoplasma gondii TgCatPRC2]